MSGCKKTEISFDSTNAQLSFYLSTAVFQLEFSVFFAWNLGLGLSVRCLWHVPWKSLKLQWIWNAIAPTATSQNSIWQSFPLGSDQSICIYSKEVQRCWKWLNLNHNAKKQQLFVKGSLNIPNSAVLRSKSSAFWVLTCSSVLHR